MKVKFYKSSFGRVAMFALLLLVTSVWCNAIYGQTTYTWQGGGTTGSPGAWATASNWFSSATSATSLVVPGGTATDIVVVNNGCVQLTTNVTIAKLTVGNTASNQGTFIIASGSTLTVSGSAPVIISGGVLNNAGSLTITATTGNGISFNNTTGTTALLTSGTGYFGSGSLSITVNTAGGFAVNFTNTNWASPTTVPTMTFNNPTISLPSSTSSSLVNVAACSTGTTNGIIAGSGVTLASGPYALISQLGAGSNTTGSGSNLTINSGCTLSCTGTSTSTSYGININNNWGGTSSTSANATLTNNGTINISGTYTIGVRMVSAIGNSGTGLTKFTNAGSLNANLTAGSSGAPITINTSSSKYEIANSGTMNLTNLTASTAPITFASSQTGTFAFINSGTITAIGGAAITANGTFTSTSINNTGGTFTANYAPSGFAATTGNAIKNGITYVWGGATSLDYQVATNWTPNRVTSNISSSDILQFSSSPAGTISNVPTQSIGQLIVSGSNTSVSLQAASGSSTTLTVGSLNNSGDEISVASGCTLSIAQNATGITSEIFTLALANISGVTGNIAGTLTIAKNTATTFANVYNAANGVTTVSGTVNYAGLINNATSGSLSFTNTSTFNNQRSDAAFPAAFSSTYNRVNVSIATGLTQNTGQIPVSNFPASVNTLTVNDAGITGSAILNIRSVSGGAGASQTADITTLNVSSGRLGFGVNSTGVSTVNIGAGGINVSGGTLSLAYNNDQTVIVTGDIALSNSGIINLSSTGTTNTATLTANNYTQTGSSTFNLSSSALATIIFNVKGNFSIAINSTFTQVSGANATLAFNSSSQAQTVSNAGTFSTLISKVQINNTNTSPNNTVSLSSTLSINGTLQLTAGLLVLGSNNLTLTSAASLSPTTPTSTSYIATNSTGRLIRQSVPTSGNTIFPIGTTSYYAPLSFTGGTAGANITVGVAGSFTNNVVVPTNVVVLQWSILASAATQPQVTFQYNNDNVAGGYSSSGAVLGTYASGAYSESDLGTVTGSDPFTATKTFTSNLPTATASLYGIGNPYSFISGVPGAPTGVSAVAGNASAAVSFSAPVNIGSGAITSYTVTSSPGGITETGAGSPITVNGLTAGTAYTFTVVATNGTGNGAASTASSSVTPTGTYTWTGASSNNYQTSTNWSPNRATPSSFDVLQFNGNASVINVPTQTISRLVLSGTASVSLQPISGTSTTLSVGKSHTNGVDEISVPSGCTLTLAGNASGGSEFITLGLASGVTGATASFAGTLTISPNATGTFLNVYSAANGVTTISGTVNNAGSFSSATTSSLLFSSGSTYNHTRTDNGTFPAASYTTVNVGMSSTTGSSTIAVTNFPASIGTLTINQPVGFTGSLSINSLSNGGATLGIANLTVQSGTISFTSAVTTINIGSGGINISGGRINFAAGSSAYSSTIFCTGNLSLSGTGYITVFNFSAAASTCSLTVNDFTQSGSGSIFYINSASNTSSSATLTVLGNFSKTAGSFTQATAGTSGTLVMNGNAAQTFSSNGFGTGFPSIVEIKNTASSPNNTVTLSTSATLGGTLKMTSGLLVVGSLNVTCAGTSGGSSTSYVNASGTGRMIVNAVPSVGNTVFPVGTGSSYAPLTFTGGTAGANITVGVKGSFTNAVLSPNNVVSLQWSILSSASTTPMVTFQHNSSDRAVGFTSTGAILGTYASSAYTESALSNVSGSDPYSFTRTFTSSLPTTTASLYAIGNPGSFIATVPGAPTNVVADEGNASATITFDAPVSNGGATITSYTVTSSPGNFTATGSASPLTVTGLTNGTTYTFTVKATNSASASAASSASNSVVPTPTTIWDGTAWSSGVPTTTSTVVFAGNYSTSIALSVKLLTINSNVTVSTTSTITVTGSTFTNNGTVSNGTVVLAGTSAQTIAGTGTVSNITVNNSAGATVASGSNKLNITGILTLQSGTLTTNGNVVLKSTSITNSAFVAPVGTAGNSGSINGTVQVERFIPKGYRAWRDIAPSVFNAGSIFNNWQETGGYANNGYGLFITGTTAATNAHAVDATTGLDQSSNSVKSAYTYTGGTWNAVSNTKTTNLNPFLGYRLLVRGDRTSNLFTTPVSTVGTTGWLLMYNATILRAKGNLITGNVLYSTSGITNSVAGSTYNSASFGLNSSSTTGFSSVANPYVAPIDWKNIWDNGRAVNLTANYYYLDPTLGSSGAYVSYNAISDATSNGAIGTRRYIQAGQAFFVENNNSTAPSLTIIEADKAITSAKTTVFGSTNRNRLTINLIKENGSELKQMDGAVVIFDKGFSNGIGQEDARKMTNPGENLAINHNGQSLSIEGRQPAIADEKLPLSLNQMVNGTYQLSIDASAYKTENLSVYLVDALDNSETLLNNGINNSCFTVDAANQATYANRFSVVFKAASKADRTVPQIIDATFQVYPNPVVGNKVNIRMSSDAVSNKYVVSIINSLGMKVYSNRFSYTAGKNGIECILPDGLSKGVYQISIQTESKQPIGTTSIIVE